MEHDEAIFQLIDCREKGCQKSKCQGSCDKCERVASSTWFFTYLGTKAYNLLLVEYALAKAKSDNEKCTTINVFFVVAPRTRPRLLFAPSFLQMSRYALLAMTWSQCHRGLAV